MRRAIFLDRDGTLVHARHYPTRPDELVLYDGILPLLADLKEAGFALIMITNQSGLARGMFTLEDLDHMHRSLADALAAGGAPLDGIYFCPHHPEGSVEQYAVACDCRKPQPGMLLQAAKERSINLTRSWFVGDILDDIEAGNRAGCRTVLVDLGTESPPTVPLRTPDAIARSTLHALRIVQFLEGRSPSAELDYRPSSWHKQPTPIALIPGGRVGSASPPRRGGN